MLYALGPVVFEVAPLNADKATGSAEGSFAEHAVLGAAPLYENTGQGPRRFALQGKLFPDHFGGLGALEALKMLCRAGAPQHLLRGDGHPVGWVILDKVSEQHDSLNARGVGREIEFSVEMRVCEAPAAASLGSLIGGLLG